MKKKVAKNKLPKLDWEGTADYYVEKYNSLRDRVWNIGLLFILFSLLVSVNALALLMLKGG